MRYPASEKAEIIRLVEASHLPARRTLATLGIPRATFYRWYDRYRAGGIEALADHRSRPDRVWNRIPETIRAEIVELALRATAIAAPVGPVHAKRAVRTHVGCGHRHLSPFGLDLCGVPTVLPRGRVADTSRFRPVRRAAR